MHSVPPPQFDPQFVPHPIWYEDLAPKEKGQRLIASGLVFHGAGDGNRTRVISLEG